MPFDYYSEFDSPATIEAIVGALHEGGHDVVLVEANDALPRWFLTHPVDVVFNIAEGAQGRHRESHIPAILESLRIPFTGSGSFTLALALDKAKTKQLLASEGLPTPAWQVFRTPADVLNPRLVFPLIVKPNCEGSAKGISRDSVVMDEAVLRRQVERIRDQYHQAAVVEEFIDGIELTVGVLGNDEPQALPILEVDFSGCQRSGEFFYSWRMKEYQGNVELGLTPTFHCPGRLSPAVTARVHEVVLRAHQVLGCADLSRTDLRLRPDGVPLILEVNPLPGLDPLESNFPMMTAAAGMRYPVFMNQIVELALARYRKTCPPHAQRTWVWGGRQDAQTQEPSSSQLEASRHAP